jgi:hypothetical protein
LNKTSNKNKKLQKSSQRKILSKINKKTRKNWNIYFKRRMILNHKEMVSMNNQNQRSKNKKKRKIVLRKVIYLNKLVAKIVLKNHQLNKL